MYMGTSWKKDVEDLNPVEDGLGGCNQRGCVIEEEQYECLICPHFATTANRIPLFKKHITTLKTIKESTLNSQERGMIEAQLKLYTAYYVKLLEKIGVDKMEQKLKSLEELPTYKMYEQNLSI